jgi:uncharacterized protein (DUF427 family)
MPDFPSAITFPNHVEPAPRRIRGLLAGQTVFDTTRAHYVWEWPYYPQYYIPVDDVREGVLFDDGHTQSTRRGHAHLHSLRVGSQERTGAAKVYRESPLDKVAGTVRFDWKALDAWYEEDEQIFVHPRSPYVRVDALRSTRPVRVELEGVVLAQSTSPVLVFETGLPTRYYLNRSEINFGHLVATDTETACPYKGVTSGYWSIQIGKTSHPDLAWTYDFPTRQLLPIAGLVAFYNEKVDIFLDNERLDRPKTHFFTASD